MRSPLILFLKALRAGERWITVHPNGPDTKGQPVLIREEKDGSAKVIGGAGGKLNHLRLTGVKAKHEYADDIRERAKMRRESAKKARERDKQAGVYEAKVAAKRRVTEQERAANREFVEGVASAMGWKPEDYRFDAAKHANVADHVVEEMRRTHELEMLKRAAEAVEMNRARILADADARAEADLGEVPLHAPSDDQLSVQDLDPVRPAPAGLGYAPDYKGRSEKAGLTEAELSLEAETVKKPLSEGQRKAAVRRGEVSKLVQENLAVLRDDSGEAKRLAPKLVEAKQALDLLKADKKRKMAAQQARAARKKIDESTTEPKAYVIDVDDAKVDAKVKEDVANDLRTIATRTFLAEVGKTVADPQAALARHIGVGAFNSVNALALAAGGSALLDRSVVDVLGVAGAAEALARRLHNDLKPDEIERVTSGMEEFHLHHYMQASEEAMTRARELQEQASEIELAAAETGGDLAAMQEVNRRRSEAIGEAQRVLGQALGEMEANAALVFALKRGRATKPFQVSLGNVAVEDAIRQARAVGLQRGDYTIETAAGNRVLTITADGLDRLSKPVNRADLEQVRRNLDIIGGKHDEDNWLPLGVADRPDLDLRPKPGVAPQLAEPFRPGADLAASVRDYIGGRAADGDAPADIVADLQSAEFFNKAGRERADEYRAVLDELAPLRDAAGKMRPAEALQPDFEKLADEFVAARYGDKRSPLHRQSFPVDEKSVDALHRALSAEPAGIAAYKPIGELESHDQRALREFFAEHVAHESPEAGALRRDLEHLDANEPERETTDMFGERTTNPEWSEWRQRRDETAAKVNASSLSWPKYVEAMHGPEKAYSAVQDLVRSRVSKGFADSFNTLNPGKPLKVGRAVVRNNLNHLDAVDPAAREARQQQEQALTDSLRNRVQGRYASGSVRDKLDDAREQEAGFQAAQMGFFADDTGSPVAEEKPLGADERYTIGHEAERTIAAMMPQVGRNFRPGQSVKLFRPTMSGGKNAPRQRAIKMLEANKRVALSFGVGTGKTLIGLAGYTHLQQQGKAKRGLFLVPSIVQGQFGGEALRFLKPGTFKWHAEPGASRAERIAAYKDPSNHFAVMTHQSFRDDMLHLGAQHAGIAPEEMSARVDGMGRAERKAWLKGVMEREGIAFDYLNVDEGHNTLNRKGKENSAMANVIDAMSDNAEYYMNASGDPVKNDVSEAFSLLQKMDPERYTDEAAFTRKYGIDTLSAKDELKRELARFQYPSKIDPDVVAEKVERSVPVSDGQKKALEALDQHFARARLARMRGKVDVEAVKAISPGSFDGVPDGQHEATARELQKNLGILKNTAVRRVLDSHPESGKIDEVVKVARERAGKPGVVFAHSLAAVQQIRDRLAKEGLRVATITGKDGAKEKEEKRRQFNPDAGEATADILVASDAGATGMNVQRGQWLVQYDTPLTAMTHAQRNGRINRTGQKNNVELIDLIADHPEERKARDRLRTKYALRDVLTSPMESLDDTGVAFFLKQRAAAAQSPGGLL